LESRSRTVRIWILGAVALLTFGCAGPERSSPQQQVVDSAGIQVVTGPPEDYYLEWAMDEVRSIGSAVDGPGAIDRLSPYGVAADQDANIYILDSSARRVIKFDTTGEVLQAYGGPGQGPGEFDRPLNLSVSSAGVVAVYDWRKRGIIRFGKDGTLLPQRRLVIPYNGQKLSVADSLVLFTSWPAGGQGFQGLALLGPRDQVTMLVESSQPVPRPVRIDRCGLDLPLGPIFAGDLVWVTAAGTTAVSAWRCYRVDLYVGSRHVLSIRRPIESVPMTELDALEEISEGFAFSLPSGRCVVPAEEVVALFGYEETLSSVSELRVMPEGDIWVARRSTQDSVLIDVFDRHGSYAGTLPPGTPFPSLFITRDLIGVIETDSLDVQHLSVKRITRGA
jgi:hypothetical protein